MSRTVIPRAYSAMIFSSNPAKRVCPLGIRRGSKVLCRSRGTAIVTAPSSPTSVLALVPLRQLPPTAAGAPPWA